jgi:uncharacterized protein (TIGR03435 family)
MMRTFSLGILLVCGAAAQSFDVASVRPAKGTDPRVGYFISGNTGAKLTVFNLTLEKLIERAYNVREYQVIGPDWLKGPKYEIKAKLPPGAPRDDMAAAVRTLLTDRFKLVTHRETKELPFYALKVAKDGPKLKAADGKGTTTQIRGLYKARNETMARLCEMLSRLLERAVVDETGLKARYDFVVDYTPGDPHFTDPAGEVSIFKALRDQLGLTLESRKGPIEVLVVDSGQKMPSAN